MNHQYSAADSLTFLQAYGLSDPDLGRLRFYQVLDSLSPGADPRLHAGLPGTTPKMALRVTP